MKFKLRKGVNLPMKGAPSEELDRSKEVRTVALTGFDYAGMKPTMLVNEGDQVKIGQPLFSCKKNIGLIFTSPAAGKVSTINRGARRVFESIVIDVKGTEEHQSFSQYLNKDISQYSREEAVKLLIESGEWTHIRQRPYEKVADVHGQPKSIFVNTMDTQPLAMSSQSIIEENKENFNKGLQVLAKLTEGKVYVSSSPEAKIELPTENQFEKVVFSGPHPAGNVGTHIHFVDPVGPQFYVWHVNYQDVIAIGSLFSTGKISLERVVALTGPCMKNPRKITTRRGAAISELLQGELTNDEKIRVISGSIINGRKADGSFDFLGHYHQQISAIEDIAPREFLGWQSPGFDKYSVKSIYLSKLMPSKMFSFTTNRNGSYRAMVPIGAYEKVMPLDILPTQLLRSLITKDTDTAQELGCLELAEEDLALLTFVDPGKTDFGPILRDNLTLIEKEG